MITALLQPTHTYGTATTPWYSNPETRKPSIGSAGDAYDNALMETIDGLYKAECIRTTVFHDGP